jgi:outer membrane protein
MRGYAVAASLVLALSAAPVVAQSPTQAQPAQQPPAQPAPAVRPPAPAPRPPAPFPEGAKYAFVDLGRVAQESVEGKAQNAKVQAAVQQKQNEVAAKQKELQTNQQKLQTGAGVLSESAAAALQKEIDRQNVDLQRFQQDAQSELNELSQQAQVEFNNKLIPILDRVGREKSLLMIFSIADAGIAWADPGLDVTADVIKALDASNVKPAAPQQ